MTFAFDACNGFLQGFKLGVQLPVRMWPARITCCRFIVATLMRAICCSRSHREGSTPDAMNGVRDGS